MRFLTSIGFIFSALVFVNYGNNDGTARLQVGLIDAPGDNEEVNIDIIDVQINAGSDENGFSSLADVSAGVYNLLELVNGVETILADVDLPTGRISQIRLILGDNNTLLIDGETKDLTVPSGSQSGLKLNLQVELLAGITYKILLDFDVAKSVVKAGNSGKYNLKPVIRSIAEATSGAIAGSINPNELSAVYAIQGIDTISTYTDDAGAFLIRGVAEGTYEVVIEPNEESTLTSFTQEGVEVTIGEVTDLGIIELQ